MHLLISLALIFGFCALLIAGLLRILKELAERDFHAAPLMADRDPQQRTHPLRSADSATSDPTGNAEASAAQQPPISRRP
jgi:hypothetical protein